LGLQIGLGFYVAQKADLFFFYLVPLIPFFYAARMTNFCRASLFLHLNKETLIKSQNEGVSQEKWISKNNGLNNSHNDGWKSYLWITRFLDDRARSVDFILLLILIELTYPSVFVTWIIFILLVIKSFVIFAGSFYLVAQKEWAVRTLEAKIRDIKGDN
jgi:hypothetical protein